MPEGFRQHAQERFNRAFRRDVELPQQVDPDKVQARYIDGCLLISGGGREASKPQAIVVESGEDIMSETAQVTQRNKDAFARAQSDKARRRAKLTPAVDIFGDANGVPLWVLL